MISPELLIFSNRNKDSNLLYDILLLAFFAPIIAYGTTILKEYLPKILNYFYLKFFISYSLKYEGHNRLDYGKFYTEYPIAMLSVFRWAIAHNKVRHATYYNMATSHQFYTIKIEDKLTNLDYMIDECFNIELEEGLYMDVYMNKMDDTAVDNKKAVIKTNKIILKIKSTKYDKNKINDFVNKCIKFNKDYQSEINKNKLYHFIFKGSQSGYDFSDCFLINPLADFDDPNNITKTFDNLYFSNKDTLIKQLDRLNDIEYYKKNGLTRKAGFLLYGSPGGGKTASVFAAAIHTKRHIIEVPMSRIKTNAEIEELFSLTKIGNIEFTKENIIILFDEIDQLGKPLQKRNTEIKKEEDKKEKDKNDKNMYKDKEDTEESKKDDGLTKAIKEYMSIDTCKMLQDDSINLGILLSRLDGIGNYNGLIIMATTNCKEDLSPALYRDGRLNPILYDYASKKDIVNIIEQYYDTKLSEEQIQRLPDKDAEISHTSIIKLSQNNEDDLDRLISLLEADYTKKN
jgi:hypothetical protein